METRGSSEPVAAIARDLLDVLASSCPDAGDDTTQLALDDALEAIEAHLDALTRTPTSGEPTPSDPT